MLGYDHEGCWVLMMVFVKIIGMLINYNTAKCCEVKFRFGNSVTIDCNESYLYISDIYFQFKRIQSTSND